MNSESGIQKILIADVMGYGARSIGLELCHDDMDFSGESDTVSFFEILWFCALAGILEIGTGKHGNDSKRIENGL